MRIRYSRWDGSQDPLGPDLSAGDLLEALSDDVLAGQGADRALSRLMRRGMRGRFGGLGELNRMIEARERGELAPGEFEGFMERYGDFFPENPRTLDELLEQMARRMAALSRLLASMSPEQRAELEAIAREVLEDMDLAFEVNQLAGALGELFPGMPWDDPALAGGDQAMPMQATVDALER